MKSIKINFEIAELELIDTAISTVEETIKQIENEFTRPAGKWTGFLFYCSHVAMKNLQQCKNCMEDGHITIATQDLQLLMFCLVKYMEELSETIRDRSDINKANIANENRRILSRVYRQISDTQSFYYSLYPMKRSTTDVY